MKTTNNNNSMKKITLASVKSFIRKHKQEIFINLKSEFDGMVDGCVSQNDGFVRAEIDTLHPQCTLGIKNAWFVRDSNDYFKSYEDSKYVGIEVMNSCSHFILVIQK